MLALANSVCLLLIALSSGMYEKQSTAKHGTARHSTAPHAEHDTARHLTARPCCAASLSYVAWLNGAGVCVFCAFIHTQLGVTRKTT